jgi:hypothetical protein
MTEQASWYDDPDPYAAELDGGVDPADGDQPGPA